MSSTEIQAAFGDSYPAILTLAQAAEITQLSPTTIKTRISRGEFKRSVKRGKPMRILRDRFIQEFMGG